MNQKKSTEKSKILKRSERLKKTWTIPALAFPLFALVTMIVFTFFDLKLSNRIVTAVWAVAAWFSIALTAIGFKKLMDAEKANVFEKEEPKLAAKLSEYDWCVGEFRKLLKKHCSTGLVKEVYRAEDYSILNVDEFLYLCCPYSSISKNNPFGIMITVNEVKYLIYSDESFSSFATELGKEEWNKRINLSLKDQDFEKIPEICKELREENERVFTDPKLDRGLITNKILGFSLLPCLCITAIAIILMSINEIAGFVLFVISAITSTIAVVYPFVKWRKIKKRTLICMVLCIACTVFTISDWVKRAQRGQYPFASPVYEYQAPAPDEYNLPNTNEIEIPPVNTQIPPPPQTPPIDFETTNRILEELKKIEQ